MTKPLVTVYITTFNRCQLLKRSVQSVQKQTYNNIEIIVVDDDSTDETKAYLLELANQDTRVKPIFKKGPKGAPASRNLAIKVANGEFITGLDDDDYFLPTRIKELMDHYCDNYSCLFTRPRNYKDLIFSPLISVTKSVNRRQLLYFNIIGNQVFTRTERLRYIGGFDERFPAIQDYETWIRLLSEFGAAKMRRSNSYVIDDTHDLLRITRDSHKRIKGFLLLKRKHALIFNRSQRFSITLQLCALRGNKVAVKFFLRYFSFNNLRVFISQYKKGLN